MTNEHVTSHGFTFSQHLRLAQLWCQWNGQKGTQRQASRIMEHTSAPALVRMLTERGVILPDYIVRPVVAV